LRDNSRDKVFAATVPTGSPLLTAQTTFLDQPLDARFQESGTIFNSPWAEVGYFLVQTGSTIEPNNASSTQGTPIYALCRVQYVVVPDNTRVNSTNPVDFSQYPSYPNISIKGTAN